MKAVLIEHELAWLKSERAGSLRTLHHENKAGFAREGVQIHRMAAASAGKHLDVK